MSHTPGPWVWVDDELHSEPKYKQYKKWLDSADTEKKWLADWQAKPDAIVETDSGAYGPRGDDKPLIAAAPNMLAALKECVSHDEARFMPGYASAKEAIAKAEGR